MSAVGPRIRFVCAIGLIAFLSVGFRSAKNYYEMASMYLYNGCLYVSVTGNGVRIYSVADRAAPSLVMTIPLDGNTGLAVRDSILYANSWGSLLALRVNLVSKTWDTAAVLRTEPHCLPLGNDVVYQPSFFSCAPPVSYAEVGTKSGGSSGTGSSYATFALIDTFLYFVDNSNLYTMSVASPAGPVPLDTEYVDWSIETLHPADKYLFVGGSRGMFIMSRREPAHPFMIGQVQHFQACDPVVVQDTIAYVTLRSGNTCGGGADELLTVSVADPTRPYVLQYKPVSSPYGLSVNDTLLYVSNGYRGYTLFSVADPRSVRSLAAWTAKETKDFIWEDSTLYVMGFDRVMIEDVKDPASPAILATIY